MNVESILRACAKPLRREEFGSAAQLANNEFGDGRYDNVEHIADALDGGRRAPGWFNPRSVEGSAAPSGALSDRWAITPG
jgi:hypothetical protein